jgi:hypothetical protein
MSPGTSTSAPTPHYVLLNEKQRIGPTVDASKISDRLLVVYGFSDKGPYDQFCSNWPTLLTPYPLVQRYLSDQMDSTDYDLRLVVIDATGPDQPHIYAATMESTLSALHESSETIEITHCLSYDSETSAYTITTIGPIE